MSVYSNAGTYLTFLMSTQRQRRVARSESRPRTRADRAGAGFCAWPGRGSVLHLLTPVTSSVRCNRTVTAQSESWPLSQAFVSVVELDVLHKQETQEWPFAEVSGSVLNLVESGHCTGSLRLIETFPTFF